ncbi:MAG: MliC family protein [Noviherbaspirillum sp.]
MRTPSLRSTHSLFLLMIAIAGCASDLPPGTAGAPAVSASQESGRIFVYACDNFSFATQVWPDTVTLHLPDRSEVLPRVSAASGAKYQKGDLLFWSKGEEALLEAGAQRHPQCRIDAERSAQEEDARLRKISLRATGNEPGWTMEVVEDRRINFVGNYGATTVDIQVPPPSRVGPRTMYRAQTAKHNIHVIVERTGCQDTMSGRNFDAKVLVRLDDREYRGCGNFAARVK